MTRRRLLLLGPLGATALAGGGFYAMLRGMGDGSFNPRGVPTMLLDKPMPSFALPGFASADVVAGGRPVLLNFFASWCAPCVEEAPQLMAMRQAGTPLWGIAYKDKPEATAVFLGRNGDPFQKIARDEAGLTAIDFGVTGVPETFLVDGHGVVRWHFTGPMSKAAAGEAALLLRRHG